MFSRQGILEAKPLLLRTILLLNNIVCLNIKGQVLFCIILKRRKGDLFIYLFITGTADERGLIQWNKQKYSGGGSADAGATVYQFPRKSIVAM